MNVIKSLYASQYYELKKKGKEETSLQNGVVLTTLALLVNFFTVVLLMILISPDIGDFFEDLIEDIFGRSSGRSIGRIIAIIPFGIIYLIVKYTSGRQANYDRTIEEFETLSEDQQKQVAKKGMYYFVGSLIAVAIILALFLLL